LAAVNVSTSLPIVNVPAQSVCVVEVVTFALHRYATVGGVPIAEALMGLAEGTASYSSVMAFVTKYELSVSLEWNAAGSI